MKVRIALHIHTNYSHDSNITLNDIIYQCKKHKINYIGITEHCNANGGMNYKDELENVGIKTIIGEEVKTKQGEIIGLFLTKSIECKDKNGQFINLNQAIQSIRYQNGLVFAPHPFDILRCGIGKKNLEKFKNQIDAFEVFNSRTKINYFNEKCDEFVKENYLTPFIGSDAHVSREIPNSIIEMNDFQTKEEFLKNLKRKDTKFYKKRLKLIDIIRPTINKIKRKLS